MADSSLVPVEVDKLMSCLQKIETLEKNRRRRMENGGERIPKKPRHGEGSGGGGAKPKKVKFEKKSRGSEKLCELCAKFGGASSTHWTKDCRKWAKDGTKKPDFAAKKGPSGYGDKPAKQNWKKIFYN